MSIVNVAPLARKYNTGEILTTDEREILLFAWNNTLRAICDLMEVHQAPHERFMKAYDLAIEALGGLCSHGNHIGYCAMCDDSESLRIAIAHADKVDQETL